MAELGDPSDFSTTENDFAKQSEGNKKRYEFDFKVISGQYFKLKNDIEEKEKRREELEQEYRDRASLRIPQNLTGKVITYYPTRVYGFPRSRF